MHCGVILSGDTGEDSAIAFLSEDGEVETFTVSTNDEIVELLEDKKPEVIALNAPPERQVGGEFPDSPEESSLDPETSKQFRGGEEELIEEGHSMLPHGMRDKAVLERADHLSRSIEASGLGTSIIESDPKIVSDILGLEGDERLEELGIDSEEVETVWEYDAVALAIVAKLYSDNRCEDHGIVVPEERVSSI